MYFWLKSEYSNYAIKMDLRNAQSHDVATRFSPSHSILTGVANNRASTQA